MLTDIKQIQQKQAEEIQRIQSQNILLETVLNNLPINPDLIQSHYFSGLKWGADVDLKLKEMPFSEFENNVLPLFELESISLYKSSCSTFCVDCNSDRLKSYYNHYKSSINNYLIKGDAMRDYPTKYSVVFYAKLGDVLCEFTIPVTNPPVSISYWVDRGKYGRKLPVITDWHATNSRLFNSVKWYASNDQPNSVTWY